MLSTLLLVLVYNLLFLFVANYKYSWALGFFIFALPVYLLRFNIGPLPTTALETSFGILLLVWLKKYARVDWVNIKSTVVAHRIFFILLTLFLSTSFVAIFISGQIIPGLGIWRAYFLEPIILFFILLGRQKNLNQKFLINALLLSGLPIALLSIFQKFTGLFISTLTWSDAATRRVTAFFTSPNDVSLYLSPLLILAVYQAVNTLKTTPQNKQKNLLFFLYSFYSVLILLAVIFTKSLGAWIGLVVALIAALFLYQRKLVTSIVVISIILLTWLAPPLHQTILAKKTSSQNRFILWSYSWDYLTTSPTNFIFGTGLRQFYPKIEQPRFNPHTLEPLLYPHNFFLNFWTETGLLGALAFLGMITYLAYCSFGARGQSQIVATVFLSLLVYYIAHGFIDNPYFKNDLAMMFWIFAFLILPTSLRSHHD